MRIGRSLSVPWDGWVGAFDDMLWTLGGATITVFDRSGQQIDVPVAPDLRLASAEQVGHELWLGVFEGEAVRLDRRDLTTRPAPIAHARKFAQFGGSVWAVDEDQNALMQFEPVSGSVRMCFLEERPTPLRLRGATEQGIWLRCGEDSTVYLPDTGSTIEIPHSSPVALAERNGVLAAATDEEVLLIEVASRKMLARVAMAAASDIVAHGSDFCIGGRSGLCVIDVSNVSNGERWLLNNQVHNLAFVGDRVWAASWGPSPGAPPPRSGRRAPGQVFTLDGRGRPVSALQVDASPVLQTVGDQLIALHRDNPGCITRFDTTSGSVRDTLDVAMFPNKIVSALGSAWLCYDEAFSIDELLLW